MYKFFAYIGRMKYIKRWGLMHSMIRENILEHSGMVAIVAHGLATIANVEFGENLDVNSITVKALFHECSEVITGDLPTPIKYHNEDISSAYKNLESIANDKLVAQLPANMTGIYSSILGDNVSGEHRYVKYADQLCAYIKCIEETSMGNKQFDSALSTLKNTIDGIDNSAVKYFVANMLEPFALTLDQLSISND